MKPRDTSTYRQSYNGYYKYDESNTIDEALTESIKLVGQKCWVLLAEQIPQNLIEENTDKFYDPVKDKITLNDNMSFNGIIDSLKTEMQGIILTKKRCYPDPVDLKTKPHLHDIFRKNFYIGSYDESNKFMIWTVTNVYRHITFKRIGYTFDMVEKTKD